MSATRYKGFELVEVVSEPPHTFSIVIRDDAGGRIADMPDADCARAWLDIWGAVADEMLANALKRDGC